MALLTLPIVRRADSADGYEQEAQEASSRSPHWGDCESPSRTPCDPRTKAGTPLWAQCESPARTPCLTKVVIWDPPACIGAECDGGCSPEGLQHIVLEVMHTPASHLGLGESPFCTPFASRTPVGTPFAALTPACGHLCLSVAATPISRPSHIRQAPVGFHVA